MTLTRAELRAAGKPSLRGRLIAVAVILLVATAITISGVRLAAPPPIATVHVTMAPQRIVPPTDPALPWPASGQAAISIPSIGYEAQSGAEHAVPVASMTKVMTAYIILADHPLKPGTSGPTITITPADGANYGTDTVSDQSSILIAAGEQLTEAQLLEGLLVHSANDFAYTLACWDAGTLGAFVAKMNATAARLGMTQTHYADASGYTPQSMSTPADLLKVTSLAMVSPVFANDVTMPSVTLPLAGTISSYTPLLPGTTGGVPGVVGVKSGYTTQAGGGDILAYDTTVDGRPLEVLAAVSSQQGPNVLNSAGQMDLALARAAAGQVKAIPTVVMGTRLGSVRLRGISTPIVAGTSGTILAWPGQHIAQHVVVTDRLRPGSAAGSSVGTALFSLGRQQLAIPVHTTMALPALSLLQRLF